MISLSPLLTILLISSLLTPTTSTLTIIGHRGGTSGKNSPVPEHSHAAYNIGAANGAAYIEPDVISSKDGVLFVMHGNELSGTSNIAYIPSMANRRTTKVVDGITITGWFSEDFTWSEISTLKLKSRYFDNQGALDGIYGFLKFEEMLAYRDELAVSLNTPDLGVYPETKLADYFRSLNLPLEEKFVDILETHGYCTRTKAKDFCHGTNKLVILQSFDYNSLEIMKTLTDLPRVLLISSKTPEVVNTFSAIQHANKVAYAVGIPSSFNRELRRDITRWCHSLNMTIHAYTADEAEAVYEELEDDGVDGVFSNNVGFMVGYKNTRIAMKTVFDVELEEVEDELNASLLLSSERCSDVSTNSNEFVIQAISAFVLTFVLGFGSALCAMNFKSSKNGKYIEFGNDGNMNEEGSYQSTAGSERL